MRCFSVHYSCATGYILNWDLCVCVCVRERERERESFRREEDILCVFLEAKLKYFSRGSSMK